MRSVRLALFAGLLLPLIPVTAAEYRIGPADGAELALEVHKTGLMSGKTHLFLFDRYEGTLQYDPENPENAQVRLVIEAGSIDCQDEWVSDKERADIQKHAVDEMLAVEQYPEIIFVSRSVKPERDGAYTADGMLMIRGQDRPVTVHVSARPEGDRLWIEGTATLDMTAYGLKPPKAALGLIGTKKEMDVRFRVAAEPGAQGADSVRDPYR